MNIVTLNFMRHVQPTDRKVIYIYIYMCTRVCFKLFAPVLHTIITVNGVRMFQGFEKKIYKNV